GGDPVLNAPADSGIVETLDGLDNVVHLTGHANTTSRHASWVVPRSEYLESWGDTYSWDGTYSVVQPLIEPLYDSMSSLELLALCADDERSAHDIVRGTFADLSGSADIDRDWRRVLHDGVAPSVSLPSHSEQGNLSLAIGPISSLAELPAADGLEFVF